MDNQQPKTNETDVAWLAGFIDGEGCVDFQKASHKGLRNPRWIPRIRICNTDFATLIEVVNILRGMEQAHWIDKRQPRNPFHKPSWNLAIQGMKRLPPFIRAVLPYLRTKKTQAETMLRWIEGRMAIGRKDLETPELAALREHVKRLRD